MILILRLIYVGKRAARHAAEICMGGRVRSSGRVVSTMKFFFYLFDLT